MRSTLNLLGNNLFNGTYCQAKQNKTKKNRDVKKLQKISERFITTPITTLVKEQEQKLVANVTEIGCITK